jgi:hypothetical protein
VVKATTTDAERRDLSARGDASGLTLTTRDDIRPEIERTATMPTLPARRGLEMDVRPSLEAGKESNPVAEIAAGLGTYLKRGDTRVPGIWLGAHFRRAASTGARRRPLRVSLYA